MLLPTNLLSQGTYVKPDVYLCETDKTKICKLETTDLKGTFKFNAYSEISFTVGRVYDDLLTGEQKVNPYYDKIEALRLIYIEGEGFGYFEIQDPEIVSDGIKEVKNITANSLEYNLSQKYLEDFYINTGETDSKEVIYAIDNNLKDSNGRLMITPVTLYKPETPELSLLHLVLEKAYGWSIGHVDSSLQTMSRTFEISRSSIYDFIMQDICEKFNCFAIFNTIENKIDFYAEARITKFFGDGTTTSFTIYPPYQDVATVSIDSYKVSETGYTYNSDTGVLILNEAPAQGTLIEVIDNDQEKWITDVYVTFENLAQEVNISYSADNIKTILTVKGADDLGIREVNMGLPYITDLSYYYTVDWMGQDLYDAYTAYLQKCAGMQDQYTERAQAMLELQHHIDYEELRLSLQYSIASHVTNETRGTYYVRGGDAPNYYYTEVQLPEEYNTNVEHYYSLSGNDLTEEKFRLFFEALQIYYMSGSSKTTDDISALKENFAFMEINTIDFLVSQLSKANTTSAKDSAILDFLNELWNQLGKVPLNLYKTAYNTRKDTYIEAGWSQTSHQYYWKYYPVIVILSSIEEELKERQKTIDDYQKQYDNLQKQNMDIANDLSMTNPANFTDAQLARLSPFLREDEYTDDNFVVTDADSTASSIQTEKELLECGKIELSKLCEPKLEFSMNMANIYALKEFEPIVYQFQLGNLINVALRRDYIKRTRLLEVSINFEDFSDFSCEFGELTNLRDPSSIHADLLSQAMQAGKSVASNASYWNKGADLATQTNEKINQGLISAVGQIHNADQSVTIDDKGILLRKVNEDGSFSPNQAWLRNNTILISSDGFQSAETGLGEFQLNNGQTIYGLLAKYVLSGYIESSTIVGGTINIGNGAFQVDENGTVTMNAESKVGDATVGELNEFMKQNNYEVEITSDNPTTITTSEDTATLTCKVYSWGSDITDTLAASLFNWKRKSYNTEQDTVWNAMPEHQGKKTLTITADDVLESSSFTCEVDLPE